MEIPYTLPVKAHFTEGTVSRPQTLAALICPYTGVPVDIGLLGVPDDTAVIQGMGRAGAAFGPTAIRRQCSKYGTRYNLEWKADLASLRIADFGDLIPDEASVEYTHQRLAEAVAAIVKTGAIPVLLGGGHDLTFGGVGGLAKKQQGPIGGIAIDAHFDVRETHNGRITSGTPFRNILECIDAMDGERFVEIGVNGWVNAKEYEDYLNKKGARIFSLRETRKKGIEAVTDTALTIAGRGADRIFCSIDLDGIAQAFAPGVSAPSPTGLWPEEAALAAYLFGLDPKVAYFDIMELNPNFDQDDRTARLAVALLLNFLAGVSRRSDPPKGSIGFKGDRP
ncbi:MAG: agmatinase family protein [Nitrospiria bacterium]